LKKKVKVLENQIMMLQDKLQDLGLVDFHHNTFTRSQSDLNPETFALRKSFPDIPLSKQEREAFDIRKKKTEPEELKFEDIYR